VPLPVRVVKHRHVVEDSHWQEHVAIVFLRFHLLVEPHHAAHVPHSIPEFDVALPLVPQLGRCRDSEHQVAEVRLVLEIRLEGAS